MDKRAIFFVILCMLLITAFHTFGVNSDNMNMTVNGTYSNLEKSSFLNNYNETDQALHNSYIDQIKLLNGYFPTAITNDFQKVILTSLQGNGNNDLMGNISELYDLSSGKITIIFKYKYISFGSVTTASVSSDDHILAISDYTDYLQVWDINTGTLLRAIMTNTIFNRATFLPNSSLMAATTITNAFQIWNTSSLLFYGTPLFSKNTNYINTLSISPNGTFLATGGYGTYFNLWNISHAPDISSMTVQINSTIWSSTFSNDDRYLLLANSTNILIFDMHNNCSLVKTVSWPSPPYAIRGLNMIPNSSIVAVTSSNGYISLFDLNSMEFFYTRDVDTGTLYQMFVSKGFIYTGVLNATHFLKIRPFSTPSSPLDVNASYNGLSVLLKWKTPELDGGKSITRYGIYRSKDDNSSYSRIGVSDQTSFTDNIVKSNTHYFYEMNAENSLGGGNFSAEVSVFIPPDSTTTISVPTTTTPIPTTTTSDTTTNTQLTQSPSTSPISFSGILMGFIAIVIIRTKFSSRKK